MNLSRPLRLTLVVTAVLLLVGGSVGYVLHARHRDGPNKQVAADASFGGLARGLYFRDTDTGRVARLEDRAPRRTTGAQQAAVRGTAGKRVEGGPSCDRFYAVGERALCLRKLPGIPVRTRVLVLDRQLRETRKLTLPGIPNRARISASGNVLSWTTFTTGDSYNTSAFSTRTGILDLRTGYLIKSIESIPLTMNGKRYHAPDVNFWGVTFARDDNRFYATVSSKGRTHLIEGDLRAWKAKTLRENVECPSLSPDNTRIAFKKKVSDSTKSPWRLYVLDLADLSEHPLAETESVDDQAAWLDDRTIGYALPGAEGRKSDVWSVPADGTGTPRLTVPGGFSPASVR
ncbi:hypothetical protein [Streptomyces sp. NPDC050504]|uniref:hypothetical protein n=1 Tax=Streptomyces sp. NPDC050504 TaxID=3365618 RepID=UPI0037A69F3B